MSCIMFARWFGIVSILLSLGILFNLEDALEMAKSMVKTETGYIMGGVLRLFLVAYPCCSSIVLRFAGISWLL